MGLSKQDSYIHERMSTPDSFRKCPHVSIIQTVPSMVDNRKQFDPRNLSRYT